MCLQRDQSLRNTLILQSGTMWPNRFQNIEIYNFFISLYTKYFCKLEVTIIICRKIDVSPERNTLFQQSANYMHITQRGQNLSKIYIFKIFSNKKHSPLAVSQPVNNMRSGHDRAKTFSNLPDLRFFITFFHEILFLKFKLVSVNEGSKK